MKRDASSTTDLCSGSLFIESLGTTDLCSGTPIIVFLGIRERANLSPDCLEQLAAIPAKSRAKLLVT